MDGLLLKVSTNCMCADSLKYNTENSIQIFPGKNCAASIPVSTFVCLCPVSDIYIPSIGLPILLQENTVCGPILGINKSLTDT